jgi:two-component system, NtrC family, sensor kinase
MSHTERKLAEKALEEKTVFLNTLIEASPLAIVVLDKDERILMSNIAFRELFLYSNDEIQGSGLNDLIIPEDLIGEARGFAEECLNGKSVQGVTRRRRKDGTIVDVQIYATPLIIQDTPQGIIALYQDITRRKQIESEMAERHRMSTLSAEVGMALTGADSLQTGLQHCTEILVRHMDVAFARIWTLAEKKNVLELQASAGIYTQLDGSHARVEVGKFKIGLIAKHGEPHLTNNLLQDPLLSNLEWARREGMVAFAGHPLKVGDRIVGVAAAFARQPLTDTSLQAFASVAYSVAQFIERKRADEAQAFLASLVESSGDAIIGKTLDGIIVSWNHGAEELYGYRSEEMIGRSVSVLIPPDRREQLKPLLEKIGCGERIYRIESVRVRKDGRLVDVSLTISPVFDSKGMVTGAVTIARDVTQRKQEREQTHLQTAALEAAANAIVIVDPQGCINWVNPAFTRLTGYRADEVIGQNPRILKSGVHEESYYRDLWQTILSGSVWQGEITNRNKDGSLYTEGMTITPVLDSADQISHFIAIKQDISERKRTEENLKASEERYRELFENASDLVFTFTLDMHITSLNRLAEQTIGLDREEAVRVSLREFVNPEQWKEIEAANRRLLEGEPSTKFEMEICTNDRRRVTLEMNPRVIFKDGKPVGIQGIARDITGRDIAEMELRQAQKLESVGRLAAGIAHEINTPIQFVGDNTRFLQTSLMDLQSLIRKIHELHADDALTRAEISAETCRLESQLDCAYLLEEIPKALSQTLEGVERVVSIVRAMKEFAHPDSKEMVSADINRALLNTLTVARNELKYVADIETSLGDLPPVVCSIGDINQVFLNLLVNSAHAIADVVQGTGKKGTIQVHTQAEGSTVLITISDTGGGIPEAIFERIFDPFFTTKEVGRGTGQGLAIARSVVVDRHRGKLTFESKLGEGTTFYVRLPVAGVEG